VSASTGPSPPLSFSKGVFFSNLCVAFVRSRAVQNSDLIDILLPGKGGLQQGSVQKVTVKVTEEATQGWPRLALRAERSDAWSPFCESPGTRTLAGPLVSLPIRGRASRTLTSALFQKKGEVLLKGVLTLRLFRMHSQRDSGKLFFYR